MHNCVQDYFTELFFYPYFLPQKDSVCPVDCPDGSECLKDFKDCPEFANPYVLGWGDFIMTSATSQCCEGCGYAVPVLCVNEGQAIQSHISKRDIEQKMVSISLIRLNI